MSVYVSAACWQDSRASGAALLVLLSLADQANDDGYCWPKIDGIADRCRVGRRSVTRYLAQLVDLGELEIEDRHGQKIANRYRVLLNSRQSGVSGDLLAPNTTPLAPTVARQETSLETSLVKDSLGQSFEAFYKIFPRRIGRGQAIKAWRAALKKTDAETIIEAAARYAEVRRGQDQRFTAHPASWLNGERWADEPDEPEDRAASGSEWFRP